MSSSSEFMFAHPESTNSVAQVKPSSKLLDPDSDDNVKDIQGSARTTVTTSDDVDAVEGKSVNDDDITPLIPNVSVEGQPPALAKASVVLMNDEETSIAINQELPEAGTSQQPEPDEDDALPKPITEPGELDGKTMPKAPEADPSIRVDDEAEPASPQKDDQDAGKVCGETSQQESEKKSRGADASKEAGGKPNVEMEDELFGGTSEDTTWWRFSHASRHSWRRPQFEHNWKRTFTPQAFVLSTAGIDWFIFFGALSVILPLHVSLLRVPSTNTVHVVVLAMWICVAAAYASLIFIRMDSALGVDWIMGYLLELIFSLENVFIFQFIVKMYGCPRETNRRCLLVVACAQVTWQMFLFMGLSEWLKHIYALPILLGICLVLMGFHTIRSDNSDDSEHTIQVGAPSSSSEAFQPIETVARLETSSVQLARSLLGSRLVTTDYDEGFRIFSTTSHEKAAITVIGLQVMCLLLADFLLEVDVTLTKIETIENHFISFTSSALAAMAMPDLFFVSRELFKRYFALTYGIGVLLIFFGGQMFLGSFGVNIPALASCAVIIVVVLVCICISCIFEPAQSQCEGQGDLCAAEEGATVGLGKDGKC